MMNLGLMIYKILILQSSQVHTVDHNASSLLKKIERMRDESEGVIGSTLTEGRVL